MRQCSLYSLIWEVKGRQAPGCGHAERGDLCGLIQVS